MSLESWFLFASIALFTALTPGPAVLLVTTHSLRFGPWWALVTIAGNVSGLFVLSMASVLGLSAILLYSSVGLTSVKFIGAIYLLYLGFKLWRTGFSSVPVGAPKTQAASFLKLYSRGLLIALTNPKAIAFTMALFPQFLDTAEALGWQFALLLSTFMTASLLCLLGYAFLSHRAHQRWGSDKLNGFVSRVFASLYLGAGGALAFSAVKQ